MADTFIYDEKTSRLFAPDGRYLKRVHCRKAVQWNQLVADDPADRSRGCDQCGHRVLNLDVLTRDEVLAAFHQDDAPCVFASSGSNRVVVLRDRHALPSPTSARVEADDRTVIRTARCVAGINRAARMGYWPDVRVVAYDTTRLKAKFAVGQHALTGEIELLGDYRGSFEEGVRPLHSFHDYYPYYRRLPIAAYLLPRNLVEGASLLVLDPIEDIVAARWNQGSAYRATKVPGVLKGRRVELLLDQVSEYQLIG